MGQIKNIKLHIVTDIKDCWIGKQRNICFVQRVANLNKMC